MRLESLRSLAFTCYCLTDFISVAALNPSRGQESSPSPSPGGCSDAAVGAVHPNAQEKQELGILVPFGCCAGFGHGFVFGP